MNLEKIQTSTNKRQVLVICIIFSKISVIKSIGQATGMTYDCRVTEAFRAVSKKMIGTGKQKIGRGKRRSKTKCILNSD